MVRSRRPGRDGGFFHQRFSERQPRSLLLYRITTIVLDSTPASVVSLQK